jgi:hypothetical protein
MRITMCVGVNWIGVRSVALLIGAVGIASLQAINAWGGDEAAADAVAAQALPAQALPEPPAAAVEMAIGLSVFPPKVQLDSASDFQSVIAVVRREDGVTQDVTTAAQWEIVPSATSNGIAVAKLVDGRLFPIADGLGELVCRHEGREARVQIDVRQSTVVPPIEFTRDIIPVLTRAGCNTGSCHGAARGKDGFRISLFGFDPAGDYQRITREIGVRRINLAVPQESLLLQKSIGAVPHTGGKRMDVGDPLYATILRWLEAGASPDPEKVPAVTKVELFPPQAVIEGSGNRQRFVAVAHYDDGTTRDVSGLAAFMTNNATSAAISGDGLVTADARGEAFVMARYSTHTVGSQVLVLPAAVQYQPPAESGNYIDALVYKKLKQLRLPASGTCSDEEFLRRVTLDIVGLMPTEEEYATYVADATPSKRARKIDELLQRKEFSEIWAMRFATLLMVKSSNEVSYKAAFLYNQWLTERFAKNVPLDQMVRELLAASGGTFSNPATNFYQVERDTLKVAENVAQVFMGIRTQCAQCHNHPFDRWTMDDYYGFAAFFSQIGRKQAEDYRELIVFNAGGGEVAHPVGGRAMSPKFLGDAAPDLAGRDRRVVLAEWLTSPNNEFFAKNVANRVWASFMGTGIVEPVDDIRVSNPASNPDLFNELGRRLIEYKYDLRQLVRDICNSEAYQRSATPVEGNAQDTRNYARAATRRIPAEHMLDCICEITESKEKFRGLPMGASATQIADGSTSTYFLTTFGRAPRSTVCACEARTDPSLSQALHLINGNAVHGKITSGGLIAKWIGEGQTPEQILPRLYVRCLGRKPTDVEMQELAGTVGQAANPQQGLEDVFWALMNSREFIFNH